MNFVSIEHVEDLKYFPFDLISIVMAGGSAFTRITTVMYYIDTWKS